MVENLSIFDVDTEDINEDTLSFEVTEDKPFNKCFSCRFFRKGCSGPNLTAMTPERVYEFFQLCRMRSHYTYQKVADLSGLSLITVKRILAGKSKDPGMLSIQALSAVLVGDPSGKYPCAMHLSTTDAEQTAAERKAALDKLAYAEKELASERKKTEYLKEQIKFKDTQIQTKDEVIRDNYSFFKRKNSIIATLSVLLGIAVAIIITALVVDAMNPNIGFFWLK